MSSPPVLSRGCFFPNNATGRNGVVAVRTTTGSSLELGCNGIDFRHYSFEGYPLGYEDEFLYYQAVEAFGITGLKWIGSPAFHLPPNDHAPINPNDGRRPCYVLDRCPLSGMLLFFPEEEDEDRRYVWENDDSRVELGFRADRGRELIAANPRLVGSVWEEPVPDRYLRF
eukprot:scaffold14134_cov70-Cylindrotheca_fusiformis.AAC.3